MNTERPQWKTLFAYHYPTNPHLIHTPWMGVSSFTRLEQLDPDVVIRLGQMGRAELLQALGMVTITTCATTATSFLACCPPSRPGWIGMVVAGFCVCFSAVIESTAWRKHKKIGQLVEPQSI